MTRAFILYDIIEVRYHGGLKVFSHSLVDEAILRTRGGGGGQELARVRPELQWLHLPGTVWPQDNPLKGQTSQSVPKLRS